MAAGGRGRGFYAAAVGLVAGVLLTGLLLPFVEGERSSGVTAGDGVAAPLADDESAEPGDAAGATDLGPTGTPSTLVGGTPAVGATSGSGAAKTGGSTGSATATGTDQPLRATDRGVTPTSIKVAFLLLDLGSTGRLGVSTTGVDPEQQQQAIEAYVADINGRGGINGRKIDPFFRVYDVLSPDDQRAACLAATEDAKAFAVIAMPGYGNDAVLCVTEAHQTPLFVTGQAVSREFYHRSRGRLVSLASAGDRMMRNWVAELEARNLIQGRTIGILASESKNSRDTADGVLVPLLESKGHKVGHVTHFSTDQATAATQQPTEVQRMRAAGVDTILSVQGFLFNVPFVQTADRQGYRPRYLMSEFVGATSDFEVQGMPASFDGALAMTSQRFGEWREGTPEPAVDARCRELFEKRSGTALPRNNGDRSNASYPTLLYACGLVRVFEAAANRAGPDLTRDRLVGAVQALGPAEGAFYFGGAFAPGKFDLADSYRFNRYVHACTCWRNVDGPKPARVR